MYFLKQSHIFIALNRTTNRSVCVFHVSAPYRTAEPPIEGVFFMHSQMAVITSPWPTTAGYIGYYLRGSNLGTRWKSGLPAALISSPHAVFSSGRL